MCLDFSDMNRSLNLIRQKLSVLNVASAAVVAILLGALSGLAMPPFDLWWVFGFTFPILLLLTENVSLRRAFLSGWFYGFGYFLVVLHWIGFAFLVNAGTDLWMMPFAVGGLCAYLALFWGSAASLTRLITSRGYSVYWVAPICFSIMEYLRGILLTGFPWGAPGLAVDGMGAVSQLAYHVGMTGLTLLILLWASVPFMLLKQQTRLAILVLATLPLVWVWGLWRLGENPTQYVENVNLRIVQPNLSEDDQWRHDNARQIFKDLLSRSAAASTNGQDITHIIWPESVIPFLLDESPEGLAAIGNMLGADKILLTGAVRRAAPSNDADYFTSVLVIDGGAKVLGHYDKSHLVPGGEFLPWAWLLEPLGFRRLVDFPEGFRAGVGAESLRIPGAGLVGAQICYEAIFPAEAVAPGHRPDWLVNVTNDGWFGNSTGPYQHLAQFRLRAIEQGLAAARSANTGISAVFDPFGRAIIQSEMDIGGAYDSRLPKSVGKGLYATIGDYALLAMILALGILGLYIDKLRVLISSIRLSLQK